jgi:outer membrane protein OmpA-like peptidoglycan-associated protein
MSPMIKILIGALATTAAAWFMQGPLNLGEKCAGASTVDAAPVMPVAPVAENIAASEAPATAETVANCQTDVDSTIKGKTINFATSSATITADSMPLIDALATALKNCAGTTVEVSGHTDARGADDANMRLSEARANSVVAALAERGVPNDRLTPKGYGETKPLDAGAGADALAKNRRIDFTVASATATAAPAEPVAVQ